MLVLFSPIAIYFVNACYSSYCEQLIHAYVSVFIFLFLDIIMFNQNVITQSSGKNERLFSGNCMQDFSNHLICLNLTPVSSRSSASIPEC